MFKYTLLGVFFSSLIGSLIMLDKEHVINRILTGKILQYLSRISCSIYVLHILV
jgi:peptidoglycan/LPS O-acetylase OafA/YrhL